MKTKFFWLIVLVHMYMMSVLFLKALNLYYGGNELYLPIIGYNIGVFFLLYLSYRIQVSDASIDKILINKSYNITIPIDIYSLMYNNKIATYNLVFVTILTLLLKVMFEGVYLVDLLVALTNFAMYTFLIILYFRSKKL